MVHNAHCSCDYFGVEKNINFCERVRESLNLWKWRIEHTNDINHIDWHIIIVHTISLVIVTVSSYATFNEISTYSLTFISIE